MAEKDLYESLLNYYQFMLGKYPNREGLKRTVQETVTPEELRVFFLLPFSGFITRQKLEPKAARARVPIETLDRALARLQQEGFITAYQKAGQEGRCYERGNPVFMTEQQVRLKEDTPRRRAYAEFYNLIIQTSTEKIPNKTPYYRVLPVESTLTGKTAGVEVLVNRPVPDPRQVLPIDKVSEMVKKEPLVAVAECYCRKARLVVGDPCKHPLETCFAFNELAQTLIESGRARRITTDEALEIMWECERQGLVHNVDNCEGQIKSICNCCACACGIIKSLERGQKNTDAPAHFTIAFEETLCTLKQACLEICPLKVFSVVAGKLAINEERCIGCGLCAAACPEGALYLVPRRVTPRMYPTNDALWKKIQNESMIKILVDRALGR